MSTELKDQALDVTVVSEEGFGGIRYWNGKLQVWDEDNKTWVDLVS